MNLETKDRERDRESEKQKCDFNKWPAKLYGEGKYPTEKIKPNALVRAVFLHISEFNFYFFSDHD